MTPNKAQQIGNDLSCLAASIAEIAEEIKSLYDFDHDNDEASDEPESVKEEPTSEPTKPQTPTLEEVRGLLADKASSGFREAVQSLIKKHGANRLSDIDPAEYAVLITEVRALK
ncbi:hypothetical protein JT05_06590 [Desulfosporosinus sp. Tol-M]|nr:hypothetical protein JT05_06590 [Desulfosporosinus sp. Tol-M]